MTIDHIISIWLMRGLGKILQQTIESKSVPQFQSYFEFI